MYFLQTSSFQTANINCPPSPFLRLQLRVKGLHYSSADQQSPLFFPFIGGGSSKCCELVCVGHFTDEVQTKHTKIYNAGHHSYTTQYQTYYRFFSKTSKKICRQKILHYTCDIRAIPATFSLTRFTRTHVLEADTFNDNLLFRDE